MRPILLALACYALYRWWTKPVRTADGPPVLLPPPQAAAPKRRKTAARRS